MIREHLFHRAPTSDKWFRWRGGQVSRLEALTDVIFAFAITLLVVSLDAPRTTADMWEAAREIPAFVVCFSMVVMLWFFHWQFFRRFGLEDGTTFMLNAAFLFTVMIYVYPLKLLFTFLLRQLFGLSTQVDAGDGTMVEMVLREDIQPLMIFYSAGCALVFLLLALMHVHALRRREDLELDRLEVKIAIAAMQAHLIVVAVAAASVALAMTGPRGAAGAGFIYFLLWPLEFWNGWRNGKKIDAMGREMEGRETATP